MNDVHDCRCIQECLGACRKTWFPDTRDMDKETVAPAPTPASALIYHRTRQLRRRIQERRATRSFRLACFPSLKVCEEVSCAQQGHKETADSLMAYSWYLKLRWHFVLRYPAIPPRLRCERQTDRTVHQLLWVDNPVSSTGNRTLGECYCATGTEIYISVG
jgi:hypothetical protein